MGGDPMSGIINGYRQLERWFMDLTAPWIFLLVPGIAVHELAHARVGRRYGDTDIDWTRPYVRIDWDDSVPVWGIFGFFLAPLVVGGITAFAIPTVLSISPTAVDVWIIINWILLAGPSVLDVRELFLVLSGA